MSGSLVLRWRGKNQANQDHMHDDNPQELGHVGSGGDKERVDGEAEEHEQYMERKGQAEDQRSECRLAGGVCEGASEGVHRQVRSLCPRLAKVGGGLDLHAGIASNVNDVYRLAYGLTPATIKRMRFELRVQ